MTTSFFSVLVYIRKGYKTDAVKDAGSSGAVFPGKGIEDLVVLHEVKMGCVKGILRFAGHKPYLTPAVQFHVKGLVLDDGCAAVCSRCSFITGSSPCPGVGINMNLLIRPALIRSGRRCSFCLNSSSIRPDPRSML